MTEQINEMLLSCIKGLKYNSKTDEYTFNHNKYKLRETKESDKNNSYCYFVNIADPTLIKSVQLRKGVPFYDGFNNVEVSKELYEKYRLKKYHQEYYKKVTYGKRQLNKKEKPPKTTIKEKVKPKKSVVMREPVKCLYCGTEFIPVAKNQKFHSDKCRKKYWSEKQAEIKRQEKLTKKICPFCGTVFDGMPRDKYCSPECYKKAQKGVRDERHQSEWYINKVEN